MEEVQKEKKNDWGVVLRRGEEGGKLPIAAANESREGHLGLHPWRTSKKPLKEP